MKNLMVIGGHSGDEAVMAGAIAARVIREGGKCVFVSLTNGDGGHPVKGRTEYAVQKKEEALASAGVLGAVCELWDVSSAMLEASPENEKKLATLIRRYRPDTVITHWRNSMHRDHVATHYNTVGAIRRASDAGYADGNKPFAVEKLYFGDNWEDADDYKAHIYCSFLPGDEEKWLEACNCYEFFRKGFYDFDYTGYYTALHRVRGIIASREGAFSKLASGLMEQPLVSYDIQKL